MKKKARSAVIWSGFDIFMRQGMRFVISIILARLLVPEDFGTLALLAIFLGIANIFVNAGFSMALIQKHDLTHIDESTVFWFNIMAGLIITLVLFMISPWIAGFFALPILIPLTMLMACNILISAMGSIHSTLLTKRLDFKTLMKVGIISTVISGGVGIYLAWADYGVWALAGQSLAGAIVSTTLLWLFNRWRPLFVFSQDSFKQLFSFSGWIFASWMLDVLYHRGYSLLIGKFYGVYDLGIYNRADTTKQMPSNILSGILSRVAFPLFSSVNHDNKKLRRGVVMSLRSMMLITAPIMTGLSVLAEPFIQVVFGQQWLPAAPIMQVLCITGLLYPLHAINLNVLQAQGYGKLTFKLAVIKKSLGIVLLVVGSFFGVMGIAWGRAIQSIIGMIISTHYTRKHLEYGFLEQILDFISSIILSVLMAIVIIFIDNLIDIGGVVELLLLISTGAIFYIACNALFGISIFKETIDFFRGNIKA